MDKIFRRGTQVEPDPDKVKAPYERARNVFMNFRVSPYERELIEARIEMSGLPKGEFFVQSCLHQKVLVKGNIRSFTIIAKRLKKICDHLGHPELVGDCNEETMKLDAGDIEAIRSLAEILGSRFKREERNAKNI